MLIIYGKSAMFFAESQRQCVSQSYGFIRANHSYNHHSQPSASHAIPVFSPFCALQQDKHHRNNNQLLHWWSMTSSCALLVLTLPQWI